MQIEQMLPALQLDRSMTAFVPSGNLREARMRFERDYIAAVFSTGLADGGRRPGARHSTAEPVSEGTAARDPGQPNRQLIKSKAPDTAHTMGHAPCTRRVPGSPTPPFAKTGYISPRRRLCI